VNEFYEQDITSLSHLSFFYNLNPDIEIAYIHPNSIWRRFFSLSIW